MKNTISELKNTVEGIKSRLDEAEDRISELEDKVEKNTQNEQEKEKRLRKNEEAIREMQDNMKCNNIRIIGIPEGEEQGIENLFEKVMMENFPNLMRESHTNPGNTERSNQEEPKEAHFKTHHNQNGKIPRQRENLKGIKGETGSNIQGSPNKVSN